jgi:hypothetical protein
MGDYGWLVFLYFSYLKTNKKYRQIWWCTDFWRIPIHHHIFMMNLSHYLDIIIIYLFIYFDIKLWLFALFCKAMQSHIHICVFMRKWKKINVLSSIRNEVVGNWAISSLLMWPINYRIADDYTSINRDYVNNFWKFARHSRQCNITISEWLNDG